MERMSVGRVLLVALYAFLAISLASDLIGDGVWPWLVIGAVAITVAVGTLMWGDATREWWATEVSEPYKFALGVALSLCFILIVFAALWVPDPVLYAYRLFGLGLVGGYVIVYGYNQTDVPKRARGV